MKKILFLVCLMALSFSVTAQWDQVRKKENFKDSTQFLKPSFLPGGIYIGRGITYTNTNATKVDKMDSVQINATTKTSYDFHGADTTFKYIPVANQVDISTVALSLHVTVNPQTNDYGLVLADDGKLVTMSKGTANTLTVPLNATQAFPIGTNITILQIGAGQVTIAATGGVTINSAGGALKLRVQYSSATLIKTATNTWYLVGDITL
jgi:hypothetical protein